MKSRGTWKTREGEVKELAWMDSVHLVHSVNMVLRSIPFSRVMGSLIWCEAVLRGLVGAGDNTPLTIPPRRETVEQLCVMNALVGRNLAHKIPELYANPEKFIAEARILLPSTIADAAQLRLRR